MSAELLLSESVAKDFPEAQIWFVCALGLANHGHWPGLEREREDLERAVTDGRFVPVGEADPRITSWFDAYRRFGTNPKRFRPSVNALSRRLAKAGRLPRINPAVDAYNLVSVRHGLPAGAFDRDRLGGPVEIRYARAGDSFTPLGEPETREEPRPGEVVYAREQLVLTRHWNHRDADQTKVTAESRNVWFMIERVADVVSEDALATACAQLAALLRPHAAEVSTLQMSPQRPEVALPGVADEP